MCMETASPLPKYGARLGAIEQGEKEKREQEKESSEGDRSERSTLVGKL